MGRYRKQKEVKILLVGERNVGKTSLILSLVSEEFAVDVPHKSEEITIPADVTPERVPTHIIDFSAAEQSEDMLISEIKRADVICIIYALDNSSTFEKISVRWLPFIHECLGFNHKTPIILVGNKVDLIEDGKMDEVFPLMNKYAEIETCIECSAKTLRNVSEMFFYAQKAVLHPTRPLYLPEEKMLTEKCRHALERIFKICDTDNNGILSNTELNQFQKYCFNTPLHPQALDDVKTVIKKHNPDGIADDGLTLSGFLCLHLLFIQRGRHETTWTVLRKFGYDDNLDLFHEYLIPLLKIPNDCSTELNTVGESFLVSLFNKYDSDKDGTLNNDELTELFSTCPGVPWNNDMFNSVEISDKGWVTLKGYLSLWMYITYAEVSTTLKYFAYLGYPISDTDNQLSAITVIPKKHLNIHRQTSRRIFECHVLGPKYCGKKTLCQGFLGNNLNSITKTKVKNLPQCVINAVSVYGHDKYLLLKCIDISDTEELLMFDDINCDVACLVYNVDDSTSFSCSADIYLKHFAGTKIPTLIVGTKIDQTEISQEYFLSPEAFCIKHKLPTPQLFSATNIGKDLFVKLATMAAYPRLVHFLLVQRCSVDRHLQNLSFISSVNAKLIKTSLGIATITLLGLIFVRVFMNKKLIK